MRGKLQWIVVFLIALVGGWLGAYWYLSRHPFTGVVSPPVQWVNQPAVSDSLPNLAYAAQRAIPSVVYIETIGRSRPSWSFWDFFYNPGIVQGAGSGVIISEDGYIVTNHHVIANADKITVYLQNRRTYLAEVIGSDPATDIALLKIDAKGLPPIPMGDSDKLRIGDWVLAIGNPMNLRYTVTAGIVSAKGRNINLLHGQFPIESFIQTDAAINPGNSGGALVNAKGELVGINAAIATKTGTYIGYGFAIPVNLVKKVARDFIEYGSIQRAFLGAEVVDIDEKVIVNNRLPDYHGVYVFDVLEGSAAEKAGLRPGDVILKINEVEVNSKAEYLERLAYFRPGDKVIITYRRGNSIRQTTAVLTNEEGETTILKKVRYYSPVLGAVVTPLSKFEKQKFGVEGGFRVVEVRSGGILSQLGIPEGFVILAINRYRPRNVEELAQLLERIRGYIVIEGLHPDGRRAMYSFYYR